MPVGRTKENYVFGKWYDDSKKVLSYDMFGMLNPN